MGAGGAEEGGFETGEFVVGQDEIVEDEPSVSIGKKWIINAFFVVPVADESASKVGEAGRVTEIAGLNRRRKNVVERGVERGFVGDSAGQEKSGQE